MDGITAYSEIGTDEQVTALYAALGEAQGGFGEITRSRTVSVRMREGGSYSFRYAPLEDLIAATRPALAVNGLAVLTPIVRDGAESPAAVLVIVAHREGGRIVSRFAFAPRGDMKDIAGQITYLRRYGYSAVLNLAADDDDDDNTQEQPIQPSRTQPAQPARMAQPMQKPAEEVRRDPPARFDAAPAPTSAPTASADVAETAEQPPITSIDDPWWTRLQGWIEKAKAGDFGPIPDLGTPSPDHPIARAAIVSTAEYIKRLVEATPVAQPASDDGLATATDKSLITSMAKRLGREIEIPQWHDEAKKLIDKLDKELRGVAE